MNQKGNYINRSEVEGYLYAALLSSGLNHNNKKPIELSMGFSCF